MSIKEWIIKENMYNKIIRLWIFYKNAYIRCTDEIIGYEILFMPEEFVSKCEYSKRIADPMDSHPNVIDIAVSTNVSKFGISALVTETRSRLLEKFSNHEEHIEFENITPQDNSLDSDFVSKKELIKEIKYFTFGLSDDSIKLVCDAINKFNGKTTMDDKKRIRNILALLDEFSGYDHTFTNLSIKQVNFLKNIFSGARISREKLMFGQNLLMNEIEKELTWLESKMKNEGIENVQFE